MNDDNFELDAADVRGWLSSVDPPPLRLDANRMVQAGRTTQKRRTRVRYGAAAAMAVVVVVAAPLALVHRPHFDRKPAPGHQNSGAPASPSVSPSAVLRECRVTKLPLPAGLAAHDVKNNSVEVTATDPTGTYVVAQTYGGFDASPVAILWTGTVPQILPTPGEHAVPTAVNRNGVVIGQGTMKSAQSGPDNDFAWVYRNGKVTKLAAPSGFPRNVAATAVNDAGDIVGSATSSNYKADVVVRWPAGQPDRPQTIGGLSNQQLYNAGYDTAGHPIAWASAFATPPALHREGGSVQALPKPSPLRWAVVVRVRGQWAVGHGGDDPQHAPARDSKPVLWDLPHTTGTLLDAPGEGNPQAVSRNGDVLFANVLLPHGVEAVTLPSLSRDYPVVGGRDLSDTATVVVGNVRAESDSPPVPVEWTCRLSGPPS
jgi:hypothetical protein